MKAERRIQHYKSPLAPEEACSSPEYQNNHRNSYFGLLYINDLRMNYLEEC